MFVSEEHALQTRLSRYEILPILCCMVRGGVTGECGVLIAEGEQQP